MLGLDHHQLLADMGSSDVNNRQDKFGVSKTDFLRWRLATSTERAFPRTTSKHIVASPQSPWAWAWDCSNSDQDSSKQYAKATRVFSADASTLKRLREAQRDLEWMAECDTAA